MTDDQRETIAVHLTDRLGKIGDPQTVEGMANAIDLAADTITAMTADIVALRAENERLRSACRRTGEWAEKMLDIYQEDGPDICDGEINDLRSDFRAVARWNREAISGTH